MNLAHWLFRHTVNSVPFGITLIALVAIYIAVGSGYPGLRESLEMDELAFFAWWPFKLLCALLVVNLAVVTVVRIPLTPPRYGVWSIHLGIILLVMSVGAYYLQKTEGLALVGMDQVQRHYYDRFERALFFRTPYSTSAPVRLTSLPRFRGHEEGSSKLRGGDLREIEPLVRHIDPSGGHEPHVAGLGHTLGLKDRLTFDVVAYHPYAEIERWATDPAVRRTGLRLRLHDDHGAAAEGGEGVRWLIAGEPNESVLPIGSAALEHRHLPTQADVDLTVGAAQRLHKLTVTLGDGFTQELFVQPGEVHVLGDTGYTLAVEGFAPQFPMSGTGEPVDTLLLMVERKGDAGPTRFRRMVLNGRDVQTDFKLDQPGAGPMGQRQKEPLDPRLVVRYAFNDPTRLLPAVQGMTAKYLFLTAEDGAGFTLLRTSAAAGPYVNAAEGGHADVTVAAPPSLLAAGPGGGGEQVLGRLTVERNDHVSASGRVVPVPPEKRDRQLAAGGGKQVVVLRVRCGDWQQDVAVPYVMFAMDIPRWETRPVRVTGADGAFQIALTNTTLTMPKAVRLDRFDAVPYEGGDVSGNSIMRDFKSTLTVFDRETGRSEVKTASLNEPAFVRVERPFPMADESWIMSQARWDPSQQQFTILQVGNRPAVRMMAFSCVLIFGGLIWAFYVKPVLIRRMKAAALAEAARRGRVRQPGPPPVPAVPEASVAS